MKYLLGWTPNEEVTLATAFIDINEEVGLEAANNSGNV